MKAKDDARWRLLGLAIATIGWRWKGTRGHMTLMQIGLALFKDDPNDLQNLAEISEPYALHLARYFCSNAVDDREPEEVVLRGSRVDFR